MTTAPDPAAIAEIQAAADADYERNPGKPLPPDGTAQMARLLPAQDSGEETAA